MNAGEGVPQLCASRRESSCRPAERFAECTRTTISTRRRRQNDRVFPDPFCSEDAGRMAVIDHDSGLILFCEFARSDPASPDPPSMENTPSVAIRRRREVRALLSFASKSFMSEWA